MLPLVYALLVHGVGRAENPPAKQTPPVDVRTRWKADDFKESIHYIDLRQSSMWYPESKTPAVREYRDEKGLLIRSIDYQANHDHDPTGSVDESDLVEVGVNFYAYTPAGTECWHESYSPDLVLSSVFYQYYDSSYSSQDAVVWGPLARRPHPVFGIPPQSGALDYRDVFRRLRDQSFAL